MPRRIRKKKRKTRPNAVRGDCSDTGRFCARIFYFFFAGVQGIFTVPFSFAPRNLAGKRPED